VNPYAAVSIGKGQSFRRYTLCPDILHAGERNWGLFSSWSLGFYKCGVSINCFIVVTNKVSGIIADD